MAADLARGRGQRGDRAHRAAGDRQAGEGGEQGAAEHAGGDEEPEAVDRRVDVPRRGRTGRSRRRAPVWPLRMVTVDDPHVADVMDAENRGAEFDGAGAGVEQGAVRVEDPRRRVVGLTKSPRSGWRAISVLVIVSMIWICEASVATRLLHLAVEVVADPLRGEVADDRAEQDQDHERQPGGGAGKAPADRPVARAGAGRRRRSLTLRPSGRSRRRAWCAGGGARRLPRACGAGSR